MRLLSLVVPDTERNFVSTVLVANIPLTVVVPAMNTAPWTARAEGIPLAEEMVEVPMPRNPFESKYVTVVEETFWITKGFPVCPPVIRSVRRLDWVVVAATVRTLLTSAVVVPMETLSVRVCSWTKVPVSVKPDTLEAEIPWQITLPEVSVVSALAPEQVGMEETLKPPATTSPELRVEVAVVLVCRRFPPEIVSPEAEERPPEVDIAIPPANVEVPVPPTRIVEEAWKSPCTWKFELTVEEAEEINPTCDVSSPPNVPVEEALKRFPIARSPEW